MQDVVESQLAEMRKELVKKDVDAYLPWASVECLAFFLNENELMQWGMIDDDERLGAPLELMGRAILSTLHVL